MLNMLDLFRINENYNSDLRYVNIFSDENREWCKNKF